jgi:endonuclease/exonuclease/phosphatase (EEP) superfamily protein YafD
VAVTTLAASLLVSLCWVFTPATRVLVMVTAFVPLALLGYAVAGAASWAVRRLGPADRLRRAGSVALVVSALGLALHAGLAVPSYAGQHASGRADLTVLTANLRLGRADPVAVRRLVADSRADVVVLEEVTPVEVNAILPLRESYPYVAGGAAPGAFGTVVFSRWPLVQVRQLPVSKGGWQMRVQSSRPFWLVAVHTSQPLVDYPKWRADHEALTKALGALDGPVVAAGDFNATLDHRPMRDLLGLGFADAARQANAGWQPTWPASRDADGSFPFGLSVLTLDHVLLSKQLSAISTSTHLVARSDHRALVARLAFR